MQEVFIGRERELADLEELYSQNRAMISGQAVNCF